ncbi:MAG: von Willebrand factor type A domain-containing protein [Alphaproteobacteria bacterium]|nr:von Willebrand factor type A domain-containing protein [Alphaproteobacteria bacterium]
MPLRALIPSVVAVLALSGCMRTLDAPDEEYYEAEPASAEGERSADKKEAESIQREALSQRIVDAPDADPADRGEDDWANAPEEPMLIPVGPRGDVAMRPKASSGPAPTAGIISGGDVAEYRFAENPTPPPPGGRYDNNQPTVGQPIASNSEGYTHYGINDMTLTEQDRYSTFSVDVDTASYAIARRKLREGALPPTASVRVEEFVNAMDYGYAPPGRESGGAPFAVHMEAAPNPFDESHALVRVGVKGMELDQAERKPVHLTFLIDTSGSMSSGDKIGLAKRSMAFLTRNLQEEDTVAIATYAGSTRVVLEPTSAADSRTILAAIEGLDTGGGTAMGSGMELAYQMASNSYEHGHVNRVVVLSDGDANIGRTSHDEILRTITQHAEEGITLSTIGFGMGNYQDTMMEQLANKGDGNYFYIDTFDEAREVFGEKLGGTLQVIAKDVKIQVEFNPEAVMAYRLVGYENRDIADRDFRNDRVDAGEIGAGHTVTALYDVILKDGYHDELATVRLRAKRPGPDSAAREWATVLHTDALGETFASASKDFRVAVASATFAELLRGSPYTAEVTYAQLYDLTRKASRGTAEDAELLDLIKTAGVMSGERGAVAFR